MKPAGKWIVELPAATPLREAAAIVLRDRAKSLRQLLKDADTETGADPKVVHAIRVCSRRVEAALKIFGAWVDGRELRDLRKLRRRAKRLRRVAGVVRDADVHARVFQEVGDRANSAQAEAVEYLLGRTAATRAEAQAELLTLVGRRARTRIDRWRRRVACAVKAHSESGAVSLAEGGKAALAAHIQAVRAAADRDLTSLENLHALRLKIKGLRYGLELAAPALAPEDSAAAYLAVCDAQERLGEINDGETVLARLRDELDRIGRDEDGTRAGRPHIAGLNLLRDRFVAVRDRRLDRFWSAWADLDFGSTLDALEAAASPSHADTETAADAAAESWRGRATPSAIAGHDALARLAAIDVGSNSVRLVIAEAYPDGTYRIVDDEKEQTRLARGLARTGRLDPTVMDEAATVIARLRAIADGYNCTHRRAVATAAVREAANGAEFLELVRDRANVELRVISAEEEGRLAFASVSHAFTDIRTLPAGVMDIGGASTEVVLSSSGVIDDIATLGMGAVSLTERFGGPDRSAGDRFRKMRNWVRKEIRRRMPGTNVRPALLVGTGGTITTLAAMAIKRDRSVRGGAAPTIAQGYQVTYRAIRDLLRELRVLRAAERTRIPGLSADRADIIVAGLCVVKEVMRHLRVRRLRVHTYGVRDGLLLSMMRTVFPAQRSESATERSRGSARLRAARRFAQSCRYEERHSEHVARLSLQIFDAMAPLLPGPESLWEQPVARDLLEAAAVLHDIGYIVNYAQHHKHAYHLIMHADLLGDSGGGFSRREVEVLANVVRYHRRAEPKSRHPGFGALSEDDRRLVRWLASILRVADGLDRTHTQNVNAIRVTVQPSEVTMRLEAGADPATDTWGATRKAGLFQRVFARELKFEWPRAATPPTPQLFKGAAAL